MREGTPTRWFALDEQTRLQAACPCHLAEPDRDARRPGWMVAFARRGRRERVSVSHDRFAGGSFVQVFLHPRLHARSRSCSCYGGRRRPLRQAGPRGANRKAVTELMPSATRPMLRACGVTLGVSLLLLQAAIAGGGAPLAHAAAPGQLQQRIGAAQKRISGLKSAVGAASGGVSSLNANIAGLEHRIATIQADLDAKRIELLKLRGDLSAARTRLAQLERYAAHAQEILSRQLVGSYESDRPDIVSVVLEAHGFNDLLERLTFAQRIRNQDVRIVGQVRAARRTVAGQATRLGGLERRQQLLTAQVLDERNRLALTRIGLVRRRIVATRARDAKASQLIAARSQVAGLQRELAKVQAAQAAAQAHAVAAQSVQQRASGSPGTLQGVSAGGGFTFPIPKGSASPPSTWSLDNGVDISAPGGTPEIAVCSGTVVLHGIGGFGPSAPILHCDAPVAGYGYVYYGHAGPGNWVAVGSHLNAGQTISEVGSGIVGISTGPHLEIGFADSSGSPVGPSSASQMMSLLQGAYGG